MAREKAGNPPTLGMPLLALWPPSNCVSRNWFNLVLEVLPVDIERKHE